MTANDGFDRRLSAWLSEDGAHRVPDHLDEVLLQTAATRQRPWWSSPERWLPMDTTLPVRRFDRQSFGRLAFVALLAIVLVGLLIAVVASRQQRLPAPFGPARNGAIVTSHDGDIYRVDPSTHAATLLVGGATPDFAPGFSRDGTKISFLRGSADPTVDQGLALVVAAADGSAVRQVTPFVHGLDWADWSADSRQIAFLSAATDSAPRVINVVTVDGGPIVTLDVGRPAHFVSWLPPLGREIVFRGGQLLSSDPPPAIYAVRPDGTGLRKITTRTAENMDDFMTPAVAPDGSRISYTSNGAIAHIHVLDLRTGEDRVLPDPTGGFTNQRGSAYFSPDGRWVGYLREYAEDQTFQFVVAPADGSGPGTPIGPRLREPMGDVNYAFTPDGTAVVVDFDVEQTVRLLPIDGSPGTVIDRGSMAFGDVQRLAP